jgi:hypothetical protein
VRSQGREVQRQTAGVRGPAQSWPIRIGAPAALALTALAVFALSLLPATAREHTEALPRFLAQALGRAEAQPPAVRTPVPGVEVRIDGRGYTVARGGSTITLSSEDAERSAWQRYGNGVSRATAFGHETITVEAGKTEQFLTVDRRFGRKTWSWKLDGARISPRLGGGGSVELLQRGNQPLLRVLPAAILDSAGRDITPAGVQWSLARAASGWLLELSLDDSDLPLPYVIDPAIAYRAASPANNGAGATSLTISKPAIVAANDLMLAGITFYGATITPPADWTLVRRNDIGTSGGQAVYWKVAGSSEPASYSFSFGVTPQRASGGIVAYSGVNNSSPIDASSGQVSGGPGTSIAAPSVTTTAAGHMVVGFFGSSAVTTITPPFGMTERFDTASTGTTTEAAMVVQPAAGATGTKTATAAGSGYWLGQLVALRLDSTAPAAPTQTISESDADSYVNGSTLFYRPGGSGGTFTVTATTSDGQSGVQRVNFPGLAGGFTPTTSLDDVSAPYSRTYTWTSGATENGSKTVTAYDNASNSSAGTFAIAQDSAAPATSDNTASIGSAWQSTNQTVTLTPSDTGSGIAATYYTTDGSTPTTSSQQGTSIILSSEGVHTIKYFSVDNLGQAEPVQTASTQIRIDKNPPTSSLSVVEGARPDLQYFDSSSDTYYYNPAAAGDFTFQDAAADSSSGVASVAFPTIAETGFAGTGATDTSPPYSSSPYGFDALNLAAPADQIVVVTDNSGKQTSDTVSFVRDAAAPSGQTVSLTGGPHFNALSVPFTVGDGSDAGAGLDPSSQLVERASAPLADEACGTFGSFGGSYTSPDTSVTSGNCYRYRFTIKDRVGNASSAVSGDAKVDTGAPSVSLTDPGTNLRGIVALTATASDSLTGVASVAFQRSPAGAGSWTTIGTDSSSPYSVDFDTASVTDGLYDLRAVATDTAGNTANVVVASRRVDNTPPSAAINNPGSALNGTVTLTATVSDAGSGISTVTFQYSKASTDTWTTIGMDASAPYGAAWDTLTVNDGRYDLRVIAIDAAGNSKISAVLKNRQVTNQPPIVMITAPGDYLNAGDPDPYTITANTIVAVGRTVSQIEFFRCSDASLSCATGSWISLAVDSVAPYSASWAVGGEGNRAIKAEITDSTSSTGTDLLNVLTDRTAPDGGSITYSDGYEPGGSVAITTSNGSDSGSGLDAASAVIQRDSASLADGSCGAFGGSWSAVTAPDTTVASGNCYRYRFRIADSAGNAATYTSPNVVKLDTSSPSAPSLSFGSFANASATGSTVYFRPGVAGAFTVAASAADAQSGIASLSFPNLGFGWTGDGVDSSAPFEGAFTFGSSAEAPGSSNITAANGAGLSTATSFSVEEDPSPPSGGSVSYADGYNSTGSVAITTDDGTDALSGVDSASGVIERESAPLSGGTCGAFSGSWVTVAAPDTTISAGSCYRYRYRISDKVGNVATYDSSNVVKVTDTPPTTPTLTLAESPADPDQHVAGTTLYYNPGVGKAGSFAVGADTSDPESGIEKVVFPALPGMMGGGDDLVGPYESVYDWGSTPTASGAYSVTAHNSAGLTRDASFTATPDSTPPGGHFVTVSGLPYYTALSIPVTLDNGSDGGSGVDPGSGIVERQGAVLSNGTCSGWSGSWAPVTLSGGSDTSVLSGRCYVYRYSIADNVGNRSAPSIETAAAKVDAEAPTTTDDAPSVWRSTPVTVTLNASDAESAVASSEYRIDGGPYQAGTTVLIPAPFDGSNDGTHTIKYRSTDLAGNVEAIRTATVRIDVTPPVPVLVDPGDTVSSTVTLSATSSADTTEVVFEWSPVAEELWTPIERDVTAPFSFSFDTTTLPDGLFDLRARAADPAGNSGNSIRRTVRISNAPPVSPPADPPPPVSPPADPPPPVSPPVDPPVGPPAPPSGAGDTGNGGGSTGDSTTPAPRLTLKVVMLKKVSKRKLVLVRVVASRAASGKLILKRGRKVILIKRAALRTGTNRIKLRLPKRARPGRHTLVVSAVVTRPTKASATRSLKVRIVR